MPFVYQALLEEGGGEVSVGDYKLWSPISGEVDLGDPGADELLREWLELADRQGLAQHIAAHKISTDGQAVLVVYLCVRSAWSSVEGRLLGGAMRQWCGSETVCAGWSTVAGSEVVGVLREEDDA